MSTQENGTQPDNQEPTPAQLKSELLRIYDLIPPPYGFMNTAGMSEEELESYEKIVEKNLPTLGIRHRSESKKGLRKKLGQLLLYTRPHTTRHYRQHVQEGFELDYDLGVDRQNPDKELNAYYTLGLDFPDKNSMFDPELMPILEVRAFKQAFRSFLTFNGNPNTEEGLHLKEWRKTCISLHREDPSQGLNFLAT